MEFEKTNNNQIILKSKSAYVRLNSPIVQLANRTIAGELIFKRQGKSLAEIGGLEGIKVKETAKIGKINVSRTLFQSGNKNVIGIQLSLENCGDQPIYVDKMKPFTCIGDSSVSVAGGTMQDYRCLKLGRHKLDLPGVFRPSTLDQNYLDASFQAEKMRAGGGVQGGTEAFIQKDKILAEPLFYIKNDRQLQAKGLAFCVLGQKDHLTSFVFTPDANHRYMKEFGPICEFDGVRLDPDETRKTHWIMIYEEDNEQKAIDTYADMLEKHLNHIMPADKSTLYCSWYFYGREFYEVDLEENLQYLQDNPMPIDAFILDNGWMNNFGDWKPNHKFPNGMEVIADKIRRAGMKPGIWTCPFIIMQKSDQFKRHPELLTSTISGEKAFFSYVEGDCGIVDTTHPYCEKYFNEMYAKLKKWGYIYHKLDFMRAPTVRTDIKFYDEKVNRAQAYRKGHELLRSALGEDAYILSCGGIYDASTLGDGLADSVRCGSDSIGAWNHPSGEHHAGTLVQIKQSIVRNYLNRFINVDPDSLMLRRREELFRMHETEKHNWLSDGKFTDAEAESLVVKQYTCGGNINFSERLIELPEDRKKLLSKIIPPITEPAKILDMEHDFCPTLGLIKVTAQNSRLESWYTLSVSNWEDETVIRTIELESVNYNDIKLEKDKKVAIYEILTGTYLGVFKTNAAIRIEIPAHGTRVLRIAHCSNHKPVIIGTDAHITGGGYELKDVEISKQVIKGKVETIWNYPVTITAVFPENNEFIVKSCTVKTGETFEIRKGSGLRYCDLSFMGKEED